ncbi:MAG: serine hydrolase [Clostridiales bacterium]|nr:serine hydrolase [Clostridiales bacterium]
MRLREICRRAAGLGLGFALLLGQTVYAETVLTPITVSSPTTVTSDASSSSADLEEPTVSAQGACLMDARTGQVLYGKNQDEQFYPASITKVMTALLTLEYCSLDDIVTFSATATTNLESGAVSLDISEGDQLTVEQALYGLLLKSANEIGNGLAEHISGSNSAFADLMNQKAASLGCKNTHFSNPHGLTDSTHKTTAYDMCLILAAALESETFQKIDTTLSYEFPAVQNAAAHTITMGHKMMYPSDSRYYEGIIGGKTGYTSAAGNTLVTGVERNGVRLVAVVLKSSGTHYTDTKAMLDYGFENYETLTGRSASSWTSETAQTGQTTVTGPGASGQSGSSVVIAGSQTAQANPSTSDQSSSTTATVTGPAVSSQTTGVVTGPGGTAVVGSSNPSTASTGGPGSQTSVQSGWNQVSGEWYYYKDDGSLAADEWVTVSGLDYYFESDGKMATGWKYVNGNWYYLKPTIGYTMKGQWIQDNGNWYYLDSDGAMLTNTVTPDGYTVDANGIWQ